MACFFLILVKKKNKTTERYNHALNHRSNKSLPIEANIYVKLAAQKNISRSKLIPFL